MSIVFSIPLDIVRKMLNFSQLVIIFFIFQAQAYLQDTKENYKSQDAFPENKIEIFKHYKRMFRKAVTNMNLNFTHSDKRNEGLTIFGIRNFKFLPEEYNVSSYKEENNYLNQNSSGLFILHGITKIKFTHDANDRNNMLT